MSAVHNNHLRFNYFGPLLLLFIMLHLSTFRRLFVCFVLLMLCSAEVARVDGSPILPKTPEKLPTMVLDTLWNGFSPPTGVHTIETDAANSTKTMEIFASWCEAAFFRFGIFPFYKTDLNSCALVSLASPANVFLDYLVWRGGRLGFTNCKKCMMWALDSEVQFLCWT